MTAYVHADGRVCHEDSSVELWLIQRGGPEGSRCDRPHGLASVPVVDLTTLLTNLGGTVLNLRGQAAILRKAADRADAEAEQLRALHHALTGEALR